MCCCCSWLAAHACRTQFNRSTCSVFTRSTHHRLNSGWENGRKSSRSLYSFYGSQFVFRRHAQRNDGPESDAHSLYAPTERSRCGENDKIYLLERMISRTPKEKPMRVSTLSPPWSLMRIFHLRTFTFSSYMYIVYGFTVGWSLERLIRFPAIRQRGRRQQIRHTHIHRAKHTDVTVLYRSMRIRAAHIYTYARVAAKPKSMCAKDIFKKSVHW